MEPETTTTSSEAEEEYPFPNVIRAVVGQTIKAKNDSEREVLHLITTAATDRAGDVVVPAGAEIANFLRNPVVMANHDYSVSSVVGRAVALTIEGDGIYARTRFRDTPLAQDAYRLTAEGLGGWSIGFRPIEYESMKDDKGRLKGFRFAKWELLEYSVVAIPMNQEIVNNAVKRGLVSPDNVRAFFLAKPAAPSTEVSQSSSARAVKVMSPGIKRALARTDLRFGLADIASAVATAIKDIEHGR